MRKTYCDRCGEECSGKIGQLILNVRHETNRHEMLGGDEFAPLDLCGKCTDEIRTTFGFTVLRYDEIPAPVSLEGI